MLTVCQSDLLGEERVKLRDERFGDSLLDLSREVLLDVFDRSAKFFRRWRRGRWFLSL